ncbi:MAG: MATE family efflux transporter [Ruminococcaceae bacterium]|nr:MATE family efflux transporter [Oscillospiraceae bacterium]
MAQNETVAQDVPAIKENKMGTMPINKLLISMALPMVASMLVQALYNIIDSLYVARISETQNELTAISLAFAAQNFMIAVASGTGVGINALLSKSLGEKDHKTANKIAINGVFLALCSYIVFLVLGFTCMEMYMSWMTGVREVIDFGVDYLSVCFIFSFGIFGQIVMERLMISTGKTHLAMITQGVGAIINIILDPIFIFDNGLGIIIPGLDFGFGMGITGAAIATVIGQIAAFILGVFLNAKYNKEISLSLKGFRPSGTIIGKIYAIGVPSIVMASIGSVMNVLFNSILNGFTTVVEGAKQTVGQIAQTSFGVYFKLQSFIFMPVFGLNNGIVPIVAFNYGAQKRKRMMGTVKLGMIYAIGYMAIGLAVFQLLPEMLLGFFNMHDPISLSIAVPCLRIISLSFVFAGFCIIAGSVFQALGKSIYSMFVSIARQLVVLIPVAFLLAMSGKAEIVWWAFPIAEIMSVIASLVFFVIVYKKTIAKIPE